MVKEDLIKRKLKTDFQRYVFKAIPQGFSSTQAKLYQAFSLCILAKELLNLKSVFPGKLSKLKSLAACSLGTL